MPTAVAELYESRSTRLSVAGPSSTRVYRVDGTADESVALAAVRSESPASVNIGDGVVSYIVPRQEFDCVPRHIDEKHEDHCRWEVSVSYNIASNGAEQATGSSTFEFTTGGGNTRITQAREHVASFAAAGVTPPNFKGAIGVTPDGVEGVEIIVPSYSFSETHYQADVDEAVLFALTGAVNNAPFKGFAAGEVLLTSVRGSRRAADEDWEVAYNFSCSPNRSNFSVGDITITEKKGWDYLWVRYGEKFDDAVGRKTRVPIDAHIERTYKFADLNGLGI